MSTTQSVLHRVGLVVDREFGNRVLALAAHMHVWVVNSPTNRVVADAIWSTDSGGAENCLNKGVRPVLKKVPGTFSLEKIPSTFSLPDASGQVHGTPWGPIFEGPLPQ